MDHVEAEAGPSRAPTVPVLPCSGPLSLKMRIDGLIYLGHLGAGGVSVNGEPGTLEGMPGKPRKAGARELVNDLQFKGGLKGPSRIN